MIRRWRTVAALNFLFPPLCPGCQLPTTTPHALCALCREELLSPPETICLQCGEETDYRRALCLICRDHSYGPDGASFGYGYGGLLATLLHRFKYRDHSMLAMTLGRLFQASVEADVEERLDPDHEGWIVPVPLHPARLLQRCYNQTALLANVLAQGFDRPFVTDGFRRIRNTPRQALQSRSERIETMQGAFLADPERFSGQKVLLVDDVLTTGGTMRAAVSALKQSGASKVMILCLARVGSDRTDRDINST